ncbi:hypothetical protein TRVL_08995 [Trypanosoma vivax]|nr:hypothetical protein TRVL_08995 [Trypanosoma vivax]
MRRVPLRGSSDYAFVKQPLRFKAFPWHNVGDPRGQRKQPCTACPESAARQLSVRMFERHVFIARRASQPRAVRNASGKSTYTAYGDGGHQCCFSLWPVEPPVCHSEWLAGVAGAEALERWRPLALYTSCMRADSSKAPTEQ